jgi:DNA mismatch repair protein MutS
MTFNSILYKIVEDHSQKESIEPPDFFGDLNLDQIIDAITKNKQQYDLTPFFFTNLHDKEAIQYRHEIMKDLEKENLIQSINSFADEMTIIPLG